MYTPSYPLRSLQFCLVLLASISMLGAPRIHAAVFNVLDYGAVPNDGQSDFNASRAAIEAAAADAGGTVLYPCGTYTT